MKKLISIIVMAFALTFTVSAQKADVHDVFVGYQYISQTGTDAPSGVTASYAFLPGRVGPTVDFGYNKNDGNSLTTIMGGAVVKPFKRRTVEPFVRGLAGVARRNSREAWAFDVGVGIDFSLNKSNKYKLRIGADYLQTRFDLTKQDQYRLSTGIVF